MNPQSLELLIPITGIVFGSLMFLIPIAGITARFALKPIMEAIAKAREIQAGGAGRELAVMEQRVALLEQQYQQLENSMKHITDVTEFEKRLSASREGPSGA
jgi:hypothetical protein